MTTETRTPQSVLEAALTQLTPDQLKATAANHGIRKRKPNTIAAALLGPTGPYEAWMLDGVGVFEVLHGLKMDLMEGEVYTHQQEWAEEQFGKDVSTNIGWAMEDGCTTSKIYGHGILTTWFNEDGITDEEFEEF